MSRDGSRQQYFLGRIDRRRTVSGIEIAARQEYIIQTWEDRVSNLGPSEADSGKSAKTDQRFGCPTGPALSATPRSIVLFSHPPLHCLWSARGAKVRAVRICTL